ncbi:MAG TPA: hypothetical protein VHB21_21710 [Minicystis sp.]|nr:hypothetical protein [Minicystis sp.]
MRSDLDAQRERQVAREVKEELWGVMTGDWGWAKAYTQATRVPPADLVRAGLEPQRPGTPDGGF